MDEIKVKKFRQIMISFSNYDQLKAMNKGSMNKAISYLFNNNADESLKMNNKEQDERLDKVEDYVSRICKKIGLY